MKKQNERYFDSKPAGLKPWTFSQDLQSPHKKGQMVAMFDFLELSLILSLKAVSVLNWKNVAGSKNRLSSKFWLLLTETVSEVCLSIKNFKFSRFDLGTNFWTKE